MSQAGQEPRAKAARYVVIREATRKLQQNGNSTNSAESNLTTAPFKELGWDVGDQVTVRVEKQPGGDGRIIIERDA